MVPTIARTFHGNGASGRLNQKIDGQTTSQPMIQGRPPIHALLGAVALDELRDASADEPALDLAPEARA